MRSGGRTYKKPTDLRIQIVMIRPIRVDHTNFFKWLLKLIHSKHCQGHPIFEEPVWEAPSRTQKPGTEGEFGCSPSSSITVNIELVIDEPKPASKPRGQVRGCYRRIHRSIVHDLRRFACSACYKNWLNRLSPKRWHDFAQMILHIWFLILLTLSFKFFSFFEVLDIFEG